MEAYFAGGCFWCMAKPYDQVNGVTEVVSGYCGGDEADPTYEEVKKQLTGHRETVKIVFDPAVVSFDELLKVYFYNIDPFDDGGQFIDRGYSYTCAVYCVDGEQERAVTRLIEKVEAEYGQKVCVSVEPYKKFYSAEEYHQHYSEKNPIEYEKEYIESGRAAQKAEDKVKI